MKEKKFDCVQFKYELQERTLKNSGAKTLREYADYVNKVAQDSPLHKVQAHEVRLHSAKAVGIA